MTVMPPTPSFQQANETPKQLLFLYEGEPNEGRFLISNPADIICIEDISETYTAIKETPFIRTLVTLKDGDSFIARISMASLLSDLKSGQGLTATGTYVSNDEATKILELKARQNASVSKTEPHEPFKQAYWLVMRHNLQTGGPGLLDIRDISRITAMANVDNDFMSLSDMSYPYDKKVLAVAFDDGAVVGLQADAAEFWQKIQSGKTEFVYDQSQERYRITALAMELNKLAVLEITRAKKPAVTLENEGQS